MSRRIWFSFTVVAFIAILTLVACGAPSPLRITSITPDQSLAAEGKMVVFTISYENLSSEETFDNIKLEVVQYDEFLNFVGSSVEPSEESGSYLAWALDSLGPSSGGSVDVSFEVLPGIPYEKYELSLQTNISGTLSADASYSDSERTVINIEGHPTPTPLPAPVVETYEEQGVQIEMPYQIDSGALQSKPQDFWFDPMAVEVIGGYEIISPIIYLDVYADGEKLINTFSPPIVFSANIPDDLEPVAKENNLVILLYDIDNDLWIPCDGNPENNPTQRTQCGATDVSDDYGRASISISGWTSGTSWGKR